MPEKIANIAEILKKARKKYHPDQAGNDKKFMKRYTEIFKELEQKSLYI